MILAQDGSGDMQIKQVLIALDQLANTLAGGYADETISSRCYRNTKLKDSPK